MLIAMNPWLKGLPVGLVTFCCFCQQDVARAALLGAGAWLGASLKFRADQGAFEDKLLNRARLYDCDVEKAFAGIQRAMSGLWLGEDYWEPRTSDLASGYLQYSYQWREYDEHLGCWQRYHADLEVECTDQSDMEGLKTLVKFTFDGLPKMLNKSVFYEAVHLAMGAIDAHLPEYTVVEIKNSDRLNYIDKEVPKR